MRRQDQWLLLADRLDLPRPIVVAACVFLNMKRAPKWVSLHLRMPIGDVLRIVEAAKPLLRRSRRDGSEAERECVYCGSDEDLTKDHVVPKSRGGRRTADNIVWACRSCNSAKGNRTPEEWLG